MPIHGCWGSFSDLCYAKPVASEELTDLSADPLAQVAFFILRVQTGFAVDFPQSSQVMPIGTGPGSFPLTCVLAFMVQLRVKVTRPSSVTCPVLGAETVLGYVDREFPHDFIGALAAKAGAKRVQVAEVVAGRYFMARQWASLCIATAENVVAAPEFFGLPRMISCAISRYPGSRQDQAPSC